MTPPKGLWQTPDRRRNRHASHEILSHPSDRNTFACRRKRTPSTGDEFLGFRITSLAPIPEPSSYEAIFGIMGLAAAIFFRRKRCRE